VTNLWTARSLPTHRDLKELGYSKEEIQNILSMAREFASDDPRYVWDQVRRDAPNGGGRG